jgi:arylsulfatase A-like enzyme
MLKSRTLGSLVLVVAFAVLALASDEGKAEPAAKPNIVYIVADDLGWKDVGFHGSDIKTPHLDELATTGARLEQFYAQPMCTPTRACLMTGRYPFRYGLQTAVIPSAHTYGLPTDEWLLPQALKEAGYQTAIIGKWHLGHADRKYWPKQRGFDYQYGPFIGEIDYFTHEQHGVLDWFRNNEPLKEKGYTTTLIGNEAVKLITEHDPAKPLYLYLYLTFNAPHTCATTRSSSSKATTVAPKTKCSPARGTCPKSPSPVTTAPIGTGRHRFMRAARASSRSPTGRDTSNPAAR